MTTLEQCDLTKRVLDKMLDTVKLVEASLGKLAPYEETRNYSADESEPYDALSDRFIRAVEVSLKFFRSYERLQFAEELAFCVDKVRTLKF